MDLQMCAVDKYKTECDCLLSKWPLCHMHQDKGRHNVLLDKILLENIRR